MKISSAILLMLFFVSCANAMEKNYTASTPAANVLRIFLGIPLTDSIDFIRWKVTLDDTHYQLSCNYGIGKANTNGFINNGKKVDIKGILKKEKHFYRFYNADKILRATELNENLLYLLDEDNSLLVGNGAWSYTLNSTMPLITEGIYISTGQTVFKDSITFDGRTPCAVPGIIEPGTQCYKLKWRVILYGDADHKTGTYTVYGTPYRKEGGRKGKWEMVNGKDNRITYKLKNDNGDGFIYLLKLDSNMLAFTDAKGNLLVGNEDFSYILNRRFR